MRFREREVLARMEASGELDRRRDALRKFLTDYPSASPEQAVDALLLSYPGLMIGIADSIRIDLRAERHKASGGPFPHRRDRPELDRGQKLTALRWCFGEHFEIWADEPDTWLARRLDGMGMIEAPGPVELCTAILDDWALRPAELV